MGIYLVMLCNAESFFMIKHSPGVNDSPLLKDNALEHSLALERGTPVNSKHDFFASRCVP